MKLMKTTVSWTLALTMALSLTACGERAPEEPPAQEPVVSASPAVSEPSSTAPQTPAAGQGTQAPDLRYGPQESQMVVPAMLYTGDGYTISIPTEGWRQESDLDGGIQEESWESLVNEEAELRVLHLGDRDLKAAQTWVMTDQEDFQLVEDKRGGLGGSDPTDHEILEVRFYEGKSGMYALMYQYPEAATEDLGGLLSVMADTFTLTE